MQCLVWKIDHWIKSINTLWIIRWCARYSRQGECSWNWPKPEFPRPVPDNSNQFQAGARDTSCHGLATEVPICPVCKPTWRVHAGKLSVWWHQEWHFCVQQMPRWQNLSSDFRGLFIGKNIFFSIYSQEKHLLGNFFENTLWLLNKLKIYTVYHYILQGFFFFENTCNFIMAGLESCKWSVNKTDLGVCHVEFLWFI